MRRKIPLFLPLFLLSACVFPASAQSAVQRPESAAVTAGHEEAAPDAPPDSVSAGDWIALGELSGGEYLERFLRLLSDGEVRADLQPYALAESLWFDCFVRPFAPQDDEAASALAASVSAFLDGIDTGRIVAHEDSDAVYAVFRQLSDARPRPAHAAPPPELRVFTAEHLFTAPSDEARSVKMYRGLAALEKISARAAEAAPESSAAFVSAEDLSSNPALLYLALRPGSDTGLLRGVGSLLAGLPEEARPAAYRAWLLLEECRRLSVRHGFAFPDILPPFSRGVLEAVLSDDFVLFCLSGQELARLSGDLAAVNEFAPRYFRRLALATKVRPENAEVRADE